MKERPMCKKCGAHHWHFVACATADETNAAEDASAKTKADAAAVQAARLGHVNQFAGAKVSSDHVVTNVPGQPLVLMQRQGNRHRWRAA